MICMFLPDIHARVRLRFVANLKIEPDELRRRLPVPWLEPQQINGAAVCSICFLALAQVTFGPMPKARGLSSENCAVRWGVVDKRSGAPAVWVEDRFTNSRFASLVTRAGFPGFHPLAEILIKDTNAGIDVAINGPSDGLKFAASARSGFERPTTLFDTTKDFASFMAGGVRSFAPGADGVSINVVDLHKDEGAFSQVCVTRSSECRLSGGRILSIGQLDSAFITTNARYTWRFIERIESS